MAFKNPDKEIYQGENMRFAFPIEDESEAPLDLANSSIKFVMADVVKTNETGGGIVVNESVALVTLARDDTVTKRGPCEYELRVITSGLDERVVAVGTIIVKYSSSCTE